MNPKNILPYRIFKIFIDFFANKAGEMGANVIVLLDMHKPLNGVKIASEFLGTTAERRGAIVAIRIHDDE